MKPHAILHLYYKGDYIDLFTCEEEENSSYFTTIPNLL